jgi:hypothetical protein
LAGSASDKSAAISIFTFFFATIDRETGKNAAMRRHIDRFPLKIRHRLSYQECSIPRIVRPPDMTVCGDRQLVIIF